MRPHGNGCQGEGGNPGGVRGLLDGGGQAGGEEEGKHEEAEEGGDGEEEEGKVQCYVIRMRRFFNKKQIWDCFRKLHKFEKKKSFVC